jgi:hypothetical protein
MQESRGIVHKIMNRIVSREQRTCICIIRWTFVPCSVSNVWPSAVCLRRNRSCRSDHMLFRFATRKRAQVLTSGQPHGQRLRPMMSHHTLRGAQYTGIKTASHGRETVLACPTAWKENTQTQKHVSYPPK